MRAISVESGEIVWTLAEVMEDRDSAASIEAIQEQLEKERRDQQWKLEEQVDREWKIWAKRRGIRACQSFGCRFHAHSRASKHMGNYCCFKCKWSSGEVHGPMCERAALCKKTVDRPAQRAAEVLEPDLHQTAVQDSVGPPLLQAGKRGDLFEATACGQSNVIAKVLVSDTDPCLQGLDGQTAYKKFLEDWLRRLRAAARASPRSPPPWPLGKLHTRLLHWKKIESSRPLPRLGFAVLLASGKLNPTHLGHVR